MTRAFVAVGSNISPEENVLAALRALAKRESAVAVSTVYETEPEGPGGQPPFYNCVVELSTQTPPLDLKFKVLRGIEAELGRKRGPDKYAPRPIDLDLIVYGDLVLDRDGLRLPDPDLARRAFLAIPLAELAPELVVPVLGKTAAQLAAAFPAGCLRPLDDYTGRLRCGSKAGRMGIT